MSDDKTTDPLPIMQRPQPHEAKKATKAAINAVRKAADARTAAAAKWREEHRDDPPVEPIVEPIVEPPVEPVVEPLDEPDPALTVACPHCGKGVGEQCVAKSGNAADTHKARLEAYKATLSDPE